MRPLHVTGIGCVGTGVGHGTPRVSAIDDRPFAPSSPYETAPQNNELLGFLPGLPALRDWTTLRPRPSEEISVGRHESDPPGYQDSLRVYFGAISKLRESSERR